MKIFEYKIAFVTEIGTSLEYKRYNLNRRTDVSWQIAMNAHNHPIIKFNTADRVSIANAVQADVIEPFDKFDDKYYDIGILVVPKEKLLIRKDKIPQTFEEGSYYDRMMAVGTYYENLCKFMKKKCKKIAVMQEGPTTYFQDYTISSQIIYYNILQNMDFILCHNEIDMKFFKGFVNKSCYIMPSLMIDDDLTNLQIIKQNNEIMIGGNMVSWYGGFSSYIVGQSLGLPMSVPEMGRAQNYKFDPELERFSDLNLMTYKSWMEWMKTLASFKYGIHLMPTVAAGTFSLNCAFLGIPCISNKLLDTQRKCFPKLSINVYDLQKAKILLNKLHNNKDFYNECSVEAKQNYKKCFSEEVFLNKMKKIFEKELNLMNKEFL